ncbi:MAG: AAA family ATPase, partial [bacterium]
NSYAVVLLDEFEKAHPDCHSFFLKLFDEGIITDAQGRRVDARNALFIMTSNIIINRNREAYIGFNRTLDKNKGKKEIDVRKQLEAHFAPEFINRIDAIAQFDNLSKNALKEIARLQLERLKGHIRADFNIDLQYDDSIIELIVRKGYDINYGARNIKRTIDDLVKQAISLEIQKDKSSRTLQCKVQDEDKVYVTEISTN